MKTSSVDRLKRNGLLLLMLTIWWALESKAQNLVPNYNFDQVVECPNDRGQVERAQPWYSPNGKTVDLMHRCATRSIVRIPANRWGNQNPVSGRGMAGIRAYLEPNEVVEPNYREYLAVKLLEPMKAGESYYLSFQVSPGDNNRYYTDDVGMQLYTGRVPAVTLIDTLPTIGRANPFFNNFNAWYIIEGEYRAKGGEDHLVIGNFKSDEETTLYDAPGREREPPSAYLFVDEVVVENCQSRIPDPLILTSDSVICPGQTATLSLNTKDTDQVYTVIWSNNTGLPTTTIDQPGTYMVEALVNGCQARDTIVIESTVPLFELGNDTLICQGEAIELLTGAETAVWNTGDISATLTVSEPGTYIATTQVGNCQFADTIEIGFQPLPQVEDADTLLCQGFSYTLDATTPGAMYLWSTGDADSAITIQSPGKYWVNIQTECYFQEAEFTIDFIECGCEISAPNAFSPNNDGVNDGFEVGLKPGAKVLRFEVFDRWGGLVYTTEGGTEWAPDTLPDNGQVLYWNLTYECAEDGEIRIRRAKGNFKAIKG